MITRKLEQEWIEKKSKINGMTECNVLVDFYEYLKDMHRDLKSIKQYHEQEFDQMSPMPIDFYIKHVEKRIKQFYDVCVKPEHKYHLGIITNMDVFNDNLLTIQGNRYKINDKYYNALVKISESVFNVEEMVSKQVEKLWQQSFTNINSYSPEGEYFLLAHVDYKTIKEDDENLNNYNKGQQGLCFSVISNKKTRLYDNSLPYYNYYSHPHGLVGIIAVPKEGAILGASYDDMLSTEYINGECALSKHFDHSLINRCYQNGSSQIFCRGTKIFPPKNIFGLSVDTINEVILDSNKIDVVSVFYVKDSAGRIPERFEEYKREQEYKYGKKLDTIEVEPRNKTGQVNLEELYNC